MTLANTGITIKELREGQKKIEAHEEFVGTLERLGIVDEFTKWILIDAYWPYDDWGHTFGYIKAENEEDKDEA